MTSRDFPSLGFDPAPGDIDAIRTLLATISNVGSEMDQSEADVAAIGQSDGIWVGRAADAYSENLAPIPPFLGDASRSLDRAVRALQLGAHARGPPATRGRPGGPGAACQGGAGIGAGGTVRAYSRW